MCARHNARLESLLRIGYTTDIGPFRPASGRDGGTWETRVSRRTPPSGRPDSGPDSVSRLPRNGSDADDLGSPPSALPMPAGSSTGVRRGAAAGRGPPP